MRKFTVIVLSLLVRGNKMAKSGTIVREDQLTRPVDELIKGKYIKEVETSSGAPVKDLKPKAPINDVPLFTFERSEGETIDVFSKADISKKEIIKLLTDKGISFDRTKNEQVLFDLLISEMNKK